MDTVVHTLGNSNYKIYKLDIDSIYSGRQYIQNSFEEKMVLA